jgi:hypothetical protein
MTTSIKELKIDLLAFSSVEACRNFVVTVDVSRHFLSLANVAEKVSQDQYFMLLIDQWLSMMPGRVFIEENAPTVNTEPKAQLLTERLSIIKPKVCWAGTLRYSGDKYTGMKIFNPVRPDRLPLSDSLYILGSVNENQLENIVISGGKPVLCAVDESLVIFDKMVIISPSSDGSDCRMYLLVCLRTGEYGMHAIQSPSTFLSVYKSAIDAVSKAALMDRQSYLRAIAVGGHAKIAKAGGESSLDAILTKKQFNVMKTVSRMDETVLPFFEKLKRAKKVEDKDESNQNFENTIVNKRINKIRKCSQKDINGVFKQQAGASSLEEMVYSGKRFRRLLGTTYNSHRLGHGRAISKDQLSEGVLASEYVGELELGNVGRGA